MNQQARQLLLEAFTMARASGKADWQRMTIAVLKNRILRLTHGTFRENDYGAKDFREFVGQAGDTVRLDDAQRPAIVELVENPSAATPTVTSASESHSRVTSIRADLWQAV